LQQPPAKLSRHVHLGFDIGVSAIGDTSSVADLGLQPNAPDDRLTVVHFVDHGTAERHVYVLNEEYRKLLLQGLSESPIKLATPVDLAALRAKER
jgi:hypothetical protein